jgi:hypothetical protein
MGIFDRLESRLDDMLKHITGEERRELAAMVSAAKTAEDAVIARLYEFKPELLQLLADAEPAIQLAAGKGVEQLVADVIALLGAAPAQPAPPTTAMPAMPPAAAAT